MIKAIAVGNHTYVYNSLSDLGLCIVCVAERSNEIKLYRLPSSSIKLLNNYKTDPEPTIDPELIRIFMWVESYIQMNGMPIRTSKL